jgi:hypothetical protein
MDSAPDSGSTSEEASYTPGDRELFESNAKYEFLETLENRGAEAPVVTDWTCSWTDDTTADCSATGYDNAPELSNCGYELLPCGSFAAQVRAACGDAEGHDCQLEIEIEGTDR